MPQPQDRFFLDKRRHVHFLVKIFIHNYSKIVHSVELRKMKCSLIAMNIWCLSCHRAIFWMVVFFLRWKRMSPGCTTWEYLSVWKCTQNSASTQYLLFYQIFIMNITWTIDSLSYLYKNLAIFDIWKYFNIVDQILHVLTRRTAYAKLSCFQIIFRYNLRHSDSSWISSILSSSTLNFISGHCQPNLMRKKKWNTNVNH